MPYSDTGSEFTVFPNPPLNNKEYNSRPRPTSSSEEYYIIDGQLVNKKIYRDYARMYNAAEKQGIILTITNAFRSPEKEILAGSAPGIYRNIPSQQLLRNDFLVDKIDIDGVQYQLSNSDTIRNQHTDTLAIYKSQNQIIEIDTSTELKSIYFKDPVARPGTSQHGNGLGLDILTGRRNERNLKDDIYTWLILNSWKYGFVRTVPTEEWHFEYLGPLNTSPEKGGPYTDLFSNNELFFSDLYLNDLVYNPETNEYISQRKIPVESIPTISVTEIPTISLDDGLQGIQPVNAPSSNFEFKPRRRNR
jgi:hypothetical protein